MRLSPEREAASFFITSCCDPTPFSPIYCSISAASDKQASF